MEGRTWPGGIPPTIQMYRRGDGPFVDGTSEVRTKGFARFVHENWIPRLTEDGGMFEYEDEQRRKLMEAWVAADQAFREVGCTVVRRSEIRRF